MKLFATEPLSSDAFSLFGGRDEESLACNDKVREATNFLEHVVIGRHLKDSLFRSGNIRYDSSSLANHFHEKGVNMRYLGLVWTVVGIDPP